MVIIIFQKSTIMKYIKNNLIPALGVVLALSAVSCKNGSNDFPDHEDGVTAYFAYQYPATCVILGDYPDGDNSLNLQHKFQILATQGGAYKSKNLKIDVVVDPSLVENLTFSDGTPVKVMPDNYYSMESTVFTKKADYLFGTDVTLTDAFFADPDAVKNTYVIPVRMVNAIGADRILSGTPAVEGTNPAKCDASAWSVLPQDYVLYCVKYINPWHGSYLRRGVDKINDAQNGAYTDIRHAQYVEKDEVVYLNTKSMQEVIFPLSTIVPDGESVKTLKCDLLLTFNGDDITVSTKTEGMTASGTGKFVKLGDKNSYNNADHDAIYLDYKVDFGPRQFTTLDTLVIRSREVAPEFNFNPTYSN